MYSCKGERHWNTWTTILVGAGGPLSWRGGSHIKAKILKKKVENVVYFLWFMCVKTKVLSKLQTFLHIGSERLVLSPDISPYQNAFICSHYSNLVFSQSLRDTLLVAQWLRHCVTNRKVAGSIPDGDTGIFHWHNAPGRSMALGSTQPLKQMSTRSISCG
jgi:hypothetical protein